MKEKVAAYELHRSYGEDDSLIDFITASKRTRSMTMAIDGDYGSSGGVVYGVNSRKEKKRSRFVDVSRDKVKSSWAIRCGQQYGS